METFVANLDTTTVIFLIVSGFIASFIDSTVGGGGLISTPALLSLGLPVPYALGTNKLAASIGCFTSVLSFWRAGKIKKAAFTLMPLSFIGSALGAYVVYLLPEQLMKNIIVVLLVAVAVYTYRRKDWGDAGTIEKLGMQTRWKKRKKHRKAYSEKENRPCSGSARSGQKKPYGTVLLRIRILSSIRIPVCRIPTI